MLSIQELRSSTLKELRHELEVARKDLLKLRMGVRTKHLKDTSILKKQRRYVARLQTVLREIELEAITKKPKKTA